MGRAIVLATTAARPSRRTSTCRRARLDAWSSRLMDPSFALASACAARQERARVAPDGGACARGRALSSSSSSCCYSAHNNKSKPNNNMSKTAIQREEEEDAFVALAFARPCGPRRRPCCPSNGRLSTSLLRVTNHPTQPKPTDDVHPIAHSRLLTRPHSGVGRREGAPQSCGPSQPSSTPWPPPVPRLAPPPRSARGTARRPRCLGGCERRAQCLPLRP